MLSAALHKKCVLRLVAKWKLHSQTQESSKMICNLPATARRFALGIAEPTEKPNTFFSKDKNQIEKFPLSDFFSDYNLL